ncbi:asparaginase [Desulforamulus ferrireducens]|uniref:asparaginase n=1 Tax=Desulforamulus ferrireducens TaxID=1833852 RepID=UPI00098A2EBF|nr:asparaginase [Desulforamulus ferrireducens]
MSELLVNVVRGGLVESQHRGHLVVTDRDGREAFSLGNPNHVTYWRSAAKPFQALPLLEHQVVEKFNLSGPELALFASSHGGEEQHLAVLRQLLAKLGLSEADLNCGISAPMHLPSAHKLLTSGHKFSVLNNPCSGKHSGMLALTLLLGAPLTDYIKPGHPVQQEMLRTICQCTSLSPEEIHLGIDGCGVPVFGLPLRHMAMAYARLSLPEGYFEPDRVKALNLIRQAMTQHPFYVAGTNRFDTILMEVTNGKIVAKIGSEGVYCLGIVEQGVGLALKIEDGNRRAIDPVVIQVLKKLGYLNNDEFKQLEHLWRPILKNHRGDEIGYLEVVF